MTMREIKFKAIDEKSGEWVFGDLIHGVGPKHGKVYILPIQRNLAYVKNCDPLDGVCAFADTVCQYTGLTDRNGVEIYEGDIFNHNNKTFLVYFSHNIGCVAVQMNKNIGDFIQNRLVTFSHNYKDYFDIYNIQKYIEFSGSIHDKQTYK